MRNAIPIQSLKSTGDRHLPPAPSYAEPVCMPAAQVAKPCLIIDIALQPPKVSGQAHLPRNSSFSPPGLPGPSLPRLGDEGQLPPPVRDFTPTTLAIVSGCRDLLDFAAVAGR